MLPTADINLHRRRRQ